MIYQRSVRTLVVAALILPALSLAASQEYSASMFETGSAEIYYEIDGQGAPIVFIHAGVADSRQWNSEFASFSKTHTVIRYDLRGFGKSEPVEGEYTHLDDLSKLLKHLNVNRPFVLIGCSMGGGLALDYLLEEPKSVRALVLVDSAPSGLEVDLPIPPKFKLVEEAVKSGDLELVSEIETQIWFDGGRPKEQVDQDMRQLAYEMNLIAVQNASKELGTRLPNSNTPAIERLGEVKVPVLAIVGEYDIPYMHAAVDAMSGKIPDYGTAKIANAAHLPNMDQPEEFERLVREFLKNIAD